MGNGVASQPSSVGLIGAAINKGQPKDGVEKGPKEIRAAGLDALLTKLSERILYAIS